MGDLQRFRGCVHGSRGSGTRPPSLLVSTTNQILNLFRLAVIHVIHVIHVKPPIYARTRMRMRARMHSAENCMDHVDHVDHRPARSSGS